MIKSDRYSEHKPSDASISSIEAILERLKLEQGGTTDPVQPKASQSRRKRNRDGSLRKIDKRTLRRRWKEAHAKLSSEERADKARRENGSLKGQYMKLRREVKRRQLGTVKKRGNWEWELSLADWYLMWSSCPMVNVGLNCYKPAWECRGRDSSKDVQLKRIDTDLPFRLDNILIVKGKLVLYSPSVQEY